MKETKPLGKKSALLLWFLDGKSLNAFLFKTSLILRLFPWQKLLGKNAQMPLSLTDFLITFLSKLKWTFKVFEWKRIPQRNTKRSFIQNFQIKYLEKSGLLLWETFYGMSVQIYVKILHFLNDQRFRNSQRRIKRLFSN